MPRKINVIKVLKRDRSLEDFDPRKIARIARAAGLTDTQADQLANSVKKWVYNSEQETIPSSKIKDKVLEEFKKVSRYAAGLYEWYEKIKDKNKPCEETFVCDRIDWKQKASMTNSTQPKIPKRILIVEDDQTLAKILEDTFSKAGLKVAVARDGKEALSQVRENTPDAVLLDLILPEIDGLEVLARIRKDSRFQDLPVIVCSGRADLEACERAKELGVTKYVGKADFAPDQICDLIKRVLGEESTKQSTKQSIRS